MSQDMEQLKKYLSWAVQKADQLDGYASPSSSSALVAGDLIANVNAALTVAKRIEGDIYKALEGM